MRYFFLALLVTIPGIVTAQSLDQSNTLNAERTNITAEFSKLQTRLSSAKTEAEKTAAQMALVDIVSRTDELRGKVVSANNKVISELNGRRGGERSFSATIKAVTAKLTEANKALTTLPLPDSPPFGPQEINKIQRVLDTVKTTMEQHRHACENLR